MEWFIKASAPFKGMKVSTASEILGIHEYELKTLTKAFAEITGIQVNHEMMDEGLIVDKISVEIQSGKPIYDFWMNDSDFIGTHPRYNDIVGGSLTDFMAGDGKDITNPNLDLNDFIGLSFGTFTDGKLYQLPDQQFANLYWFRYDWFQKPELKAAFKAKFGYELGVPVNWSAYEDIADFFTNTVKEIDGQKVYGHMDYGKKDPSLGWRFTDAWLSMAGNGDRGLPNGRPVDEWGIRAENGIPVGSSISRGGDANGPAAVYALAKFVEWLKKYAPPEAAGMDFLEAGAVPGQGHIAQQIFWYSAFTAALSKPDLPVMNKDGTPKWRMAPEPAWRLLEGGHEARLPGRRLLDPAQIRSAGAREGGLALLAVLRVEDGQPEEVGHLPACHSRKRYPEPGDDRSCAESRRLGRVLPQPGAQALDADRRQRARIRQARSGLVAERLQGHLRRADIPAGDGRAGPRSGRDHDAAREVRRPGQARAEDERGAGSGILVRQGREGRQCSRPSASSPMKSRQEKPSTTTNS